MKKEALRVTTTIPVAPTTLYFAWIDSDHHSAMTGGTAKFDPTVGAKFTAWNGYISGKLVILDLGRRIVMSWRTTDFPRDASDSRVEVHFEALGPSTRVLILHTEVPEGQSEKVRSYWNDKYFGPMRTYFSKFLPDPRNPPVRRPPPPPPEDDGDEEEEDEDARPKKGKLLARGKVAPTKAVPAKAVPAKAVPAKGVPAKAAPTKGVPAKAAPTKGVPAKAAPAKAPVKAGPAPAAPTVKGKPAAPAKGKGAPPPKKAPPAPKPAAKKPAKPASKPAAKKPAKPASKPAAKKPTKKKH